MKARQYQAESFYTMISRVRVENIKWATKIGPDRHMICRVHISEVWKRADPLIQWNWCPTGARNLRAGNGMASAHYGTPFVAMVQRIIYSRMIKIQMHT